MQEMIEVIVGYKNTVVAKSAESLIRQIYHNTPEEKKLIIVPWPPKSISKEKEQDIIKKLEPVVSESAKPVINSIPEPESPPYIINKTSIDLPGVPAKKKPGRPKKQT